MELPRRRHRCCRAGSGATSKAVPALFGDRLPLVLHVIDLSKQQFVPSQNRMLPQNIQQSIPRFQSWAMQKAQSWIKPGADYPIRVETGPP
eukprot:3934909-Rhodomonas_salina.5